MAMMRTHTDYDLAQLEELQRLVGKTLAKKQTRRKRTTTLSWAVGFFMSGLAFLVWEKGAILTLLFCGWGLWLLFQGIFFYPWSAWRAHKAMGKNGQGNDFFFEKNAILATRGTEGDRYPYTSCTELLETERSFYVFLEGGQGLMLDKSNVKGGTAQELGKLLEERCGKTLTRVDVGKCWLK